MWFPSGKDILVNEVKVLIIGYFHTPSLVRPVVSIQLQILNVHKKMKALIFNDLLAFQNS